MGKRLEQHNTVEALNGDRNALKRKADSLSSPEIDEMRRPRVLMKSAAELFMAPRFQLVESSS